MAGTVSLYLKFFDQRHANLFFYLYQQVLAGNCSTSMILFEISTVVNKTRPGLSSNKKK